LARQQIDHGHDWRRVLTHPLMGTLVPVWFMAAFALSALAVRGELVEQLVLALQIDTILPMAAPPLGVTARLMIALGFGLVGALLGHLVLRWLVGDSAPLAHDDAADYRRRRTGDGHPDAPARRPIHAHDELGAYGFDHTGHEAAPYEPVPYQPAPSYIPAPAPAAAAEPLVLDTALTFAPVPAVPNPPPLAELNQPAPLSPLDPVRGTPLTPYEAHDISSAPVPAPAPRVSVVAPEEEPVEPVSVQPAPVQPAPMISAKDALPLRNIPRIVEKPLPVANPEPAAAERLTAAPLEALGHVELIERLAVAMQRRQSASVAAQQQSVPDESAVAASQQAAMPANDQTSAALRAALAGLRQVQ